MERCLLLAILAVQDGLVTAPEVLACLAGVRTGLVDLERTLLNSGRVTQEQWDALQQKCSEEERRHGGLLKALEVLSSDASLLLASTETVEMPRNQALPEGLRPEIAAEMGPITLENPGRYRVLKEIGRGAIGRVVSTHDYHLGREVALKELLPSDPVLERLDPSRRTMQVVRFLREARVTARLEHPSIVPVYELGVRPDGSLYYCMKHVNGRTLHEAIQDPRTAENQRTLLDHFFSLCQAIAYAHANGVIHRDIKPKNVMLGEFGETVLLDWGLAKVLGSPEDPLDMIPVSLDGLSSQETQAGFTVGTPAYMSPEQAAGERSAVDQRTDVWALGIVLYEILTGTVPFKGNRAHEVLDAVSRQKIFPPHELSPELDRDLSAVCIKALEKSVQHRYQTAEALANDIKAYLSGRRVSAYPYSKIELVKKFVRHNRMLSVMTVALAVALVGGAGWVTFLFFNSEHNRIAAVYEGEEKAKALEQVQREKERVELARLVTEKSNREAHQNLSVALEEESRRRLVDLDFLGSDVFAAAALVHTPNNPRSPYAAPPGTAPPDPKATEQLAKIRSLLYFGEVNRRQYLDWSVVVPGESPIGATQLASGDWGAIGVDGQFYVLDQNTHQTKTVHPLGAKGAMAEFSVDGKWLAFRGFEAGLLLIPTDKPGLASRINRAWIKQLFSVRFSADSHTLLVSLDSGEVMMLPVAQAADEGADGKRYFSETGSPKRAMALSPNKEWLAAGAENGQVCLVNLVTADAKHRCWEPHTGNVLDMTFTSDSESLFSAGYDGHVVLTEVASQKELWRTRAVDGHILRLALLGSDAAVYAGSHDGWLVRLSVKDGSVVERFRAHMGTIRSLRLLAGGDHVLSLSEDGRLSMWRVNTALAKTVRAPAQAAFNHIALSSDDTWLATIDTLFQVCLWDLRSPDATPECQKSGQLWDVAWSNDNKWVAVGRSRREVGLWSLQEKTFKVWEPFGDNTVVSVGFTPDSKYLIAAAGGKLNVWDVRAALRSGAPVPEQSHLLGSGSLWALAMLPDGKTMVLTRDGNLDFVSIKDGKLPKTIDVSQKELTSISLSKDGKLAAVSGKDGIAYLVDLDKGVVVRQYTGHAAWVNTVKLSPDGTLLLTGSDDKTFRLWDAATGAPLVIGDVGAEVLGLAFASDSRSFLVTEKGEVRIYPIVADSVLEEPVTLLEKAQSRQGMVLNGFALELP